MQLTAPPLRCRHRRSPVGQAASASARCTPPEPCRPRPTCSARGCSISSRLIDDARRALVRRRGRPVRAGGPLNVCSARFRASRPRAARPPRAGAAEDDRVPLPASGTCARSLRRTRRTWRRELILAGSAATSCGCASARSTSPGTRVGPASPSRIAENRPPRARRGSPTCGAGLENLVLRRAPLRWSQRLRAVHVSRGKAPARLFGCG